MATAPPCSAGTNRTVSAPRVQEGRANLGHPLLLLLLTSVCFAGVDSLEVFIFLWGWEVFNGMKGVFGFKVIWEETGKGAGEGEPGQSPRARLCGGSLRGSHSPRNALTVEMESRCPFRTGGGGGGGPAGVRVGGGGGFPRLGGSAGPCSL